MLQHGIKSEGERAAVWMIGSWVQIDSCRNLETFSCGDSWFDSSAETWRSHSHRRKVKATIVVFDKHTHTHTPAEGQLGANTKSLWEYNIKPYLPFTSVFFKCSKVCVRPLKSDPAEGRLCPISYRAGGQKCWAPDESGFLNSFFLYSHILGFI